MEARSDLFCRNWKGVCAARGVRDGLDSPRYRALLTTLERAAEYPPLAEAAGEACCVVLPSAVKSAWRRLRKAARHLHADDPDDEFHEARKRAKSARYTAELIAPLLGRRSECDAGQRIHATRCQSSGCSGRAPGCPDHDR